MLHMETKPVAVQHLYGYSLNQTQFKHGLRDLATRVDRLNYLVAKEKRKQEERYQQDEERRLLEKEEQERLPTG